MTTKRSLGASGIDDTVVTIYTVPDRKMAEWVLLYVTNPSENNDDFHLEIYDSSENATITILDEYLLDAKDFLVIGGDANSFVMLEEGDQIKAHGDSNSNFSVLISVIEHNATAVRG